MRKIRDHKLSAVTAAVWAGVLLVEALAAIWETAGGSGMSFPERYWTKFLFPTIPFLLLFIIHDLLVAPMLVYAKRLLPYLLCTALLMGGFSSYVFEMAGRADVRPEHGERYGPRPLPPNASAGGRDISPEKDSPMKPPPGMDGSEMHDGLPHGDPPFKRRGERPVGAEISKIVMALMMLGVNLGAKYRTAYSLEKKRLDRLEKENLRYRLEYLRNQINPHFFMNTLNNIHALVDDSPEKAKDSIVELSRMMRHVLYDSDSPVVSLSKEMDFLRHYLYLMRLRFTDNVRIESSFPEDDGGAQIPPLLMTTVVENAFKHGVSYESGCHIRLSVALDGGRLIFRCANSVAPGQDGRTAGGVGLDNIRKRLALLYGEDFVLHIEKSAEEYEVIVVLPLKPVSEIV